MVLLPEIAESLSSQHICLTKDPTSAHWSQAYFRGHTCISASFVTSKLRVSGKDSCAGWWGLEIVIIRCECRDFKVMGCRCVN